MRGTLRVNWRRQQGMFDDRITFTQQAIESGHGRGVEKDHCKRPIHEEEATNGRDDPGVFQKTIKHHCHRGWIKRCYIWWCFADREFFPLWWKCRKYRSWMIFSTPSPSLLKKAALEISDIIYFISSCHELQEGFEIDLFLPRCSQRFSRCLHQIQKTAVGNSESEVRFEIE